MTNAIEPTAAEIERVKAAIAGVQCFVRYNDESSMPVEVCRYGHEGEDEIVVLQRFHDDTSSLDALGIVIADLRARAAILAMDRRAEVVDEDDIADAIRDSIDMDWTARDGARAVMELLRRASPPAEPVAWPNGCDRTVPAALRYLTRYNRPQGGEQQFNAAHLWQLADEIESMAARPLYASPTPAPAVAVPEEAPALAFNVFREALEQIATGKSADLNSPSDYARGWNDARFRFRQIAASALDAAPESPAAEAPVQEPVANGWFGPYAVEFVGPAVWASVVDEMDPRLVGKKVYVTVDDRSVPAANAPGQEPVAVLRGVSIMKTVEEGFFAWATKPRNKKWTQRIAGTPIQNNLTVCISMALIDAVRRPASSAPTTYADAEAKEFARGVEAAAEWVESQVDELNSLLEAYPGDPTGQIAREIELIHAHAAAIRSLASPAPKGET